MNSTKLYKLGRWSVYVPESIIERNDFGFYLRFEILIGPFDSEQELAMWLINNKDRAISNGVMVEYNTPPKYAHLQTVNQEDIIKIMRAFVIHGIEHHYVPPEFDQLLVYVVMIKRSDLKSAQHALDMEYKEKNC